MDITWSWVVKAMYTQPQAGKSNVVVDVVFELIGSLPSTMTIQGPFASTSGSVQFVYSGGEFTPYQELTQNQVIEWVQKTLGTDGVANLQAAVQAQLHPAPSGASGPVQQPLPWR